MDPDSSVGYRSQGYLPSISNGENDGELTATVQPTALNFGVKLVSKYADWAGFAGLAVC
jgi:hypothetical protein